MLSGAAGFDAFLRAIKEIRFLVSGGRHNKRHDIDDVTYQEDGHIVLKHGFPKRMAEWDKERSHLSPGLLALIQSRLFGY